MCNKEIGYKLVEWIYRAKDKDLGWAGVWNVMRILNF